MSFWPLTLRSSILLCVVITSCINHIPQDRVAQSIDAMQSLCLAKSGLTIETKEGGSIFLLKKGAKVEGQYKETEIKTLLDKLQNEVNLLAEGDQIRKCTSPYIGTILGLIAGNPQINRIVELDKIQDKSGNEILDLQKVPMTIRAIIKVVNPNSSRLYLIVSGLDTHGSPYAQVRTSPAIGILNKSGPFDIEISLESGKSYTVFAILSRKEYKDGERFNPEADHESSESKRLTVIDSSDRPYQPVKPSIAKMQDALLSKENLKSTLLDTQEAYNICITTLLPTKDAKQRSSSVKPGTPAPLTMVTGPLTGTFYRFGLDIIELIVFLKNDIELEVIHSGGGNVNPEIVVATDNKISLGMTQIDVLMQLRQNEPAKADNVKVLLPLYNEEVHLLANKKFKDIHSLSSPDTIVHVGSPQLGSHKTAKELLRHFNISTQNEFEDRDPHEAICEVLTGQAHAMFFNGGKPVPHFERLNNLPLKYRHLLEDIHFVPITLSNNEKTGFLQYFNKTNITPLDYKWMSQQDGNVNTISIRAVLIGFDFSPKENRFKNSYYERRCKEFSKLRLLLKNNLRLLRSDISKKYHKKWNDVDFSASVPWELDQCP